MKRVLCIFVCLFLLISCSFAEELPRNVGETDPAYVWLYEKSLTVADRFQQGLDCTWHSFLLSAANVPEQEMEAALAPLRMQDYTQPMAVTFVRADRLLPDEMIQGWQAALKAEEEAKAIRAALRSAELVNELAVVKLANAEEAVLQTTAEAVKAAEEAFKAAEAAAQAAEGEAAVQSAKEIAQAAEDAFKAAEAAAQAVKEVEKGEAFLAAKEAAKAAEKTSNMVKEARKAAEEAAKTAAEEAEETADAAENAKKTEKKEKTPAELAAEDAAARIEAAVAAADKASKAAEEAFKAKANAIQAAQTLADLQAGKLAPDTEDDSELEFDDNFDFEEDSVLDFDDGDYLSLDFDFEADSDGTDGTPDDDWDLDWDWDDWDDSGSPNAAPQQEVKRTWFIEEDPERDLYHSAAKVLNFQEKDEMFRAISDAIQVTGFYTSDSPLDGPHYAVMYYGGLYALLITYYPAGDGFVSVNAQVISRSADQLLKP